ncbi:hypothetical protein IE077_002348 [Cardiosporidium cionae]|uniref:Uncharacterized protein n=1 Tax=Cardiosporidium cionae TaxID=476202 RepID=A0ABQ7JFR1_9APIC|nr:hypothetical protein IE077_002348 [Cardiosporidium cionae]|eukprot:KAF8822860.1 hypothetical protein IE077_002348 [Cardiosporidium cionae]
MDQMEHKNITAAREAKKTRKSILRDYKSTSFSLWFPTLTRVATRKDKFFFWLGVVFTFLSGCIVVASIYTFYLLLSKLQFNIPQFLLTFPLLLFYLIGVVAIFIGGFGKYFLHQYGHNVALYYRFGFFRNLLELPIDTFYEKSSYLNYICEAIKTLTEGLSFRFLQIIFYLAAIVGSSIFVSYNFQFILSYFSLEFALFVVISSFSFSYFDKEWKPLSFEYDKTIDALCCNTTISFHSAAKYFEKFYSLELDIQYIFLFSLIFSKFLYFINFFAYLFYLVLVSDVGILTFLPSPFFEYDNHHQFISILGTMGSIFFILFFGNLFKLLVDHLNEVSLFKGRLFTDIPFLNGNLEFCDVSFKYENQSSFILNNLSFKVTNGETIAFLDTSGEANSVIAKLILGLEVSSSCRILIDGVSPQNREASFCHNFGVLFSSFKNGSLATLDSFPMKVLQTSVFTEDCNFKTSTEEEKLFWREAARLMMSPRRPFLLVEEFEKEMKLNPTCENLFKNFLQEKNRTSLLFCKKFPRLATPNYLFVLGNLQNDGFCIVKTQMFNDEEISLPLISSTQKKTNEEHLMENFHKEKDEKDIPDFSIWVLFSLLFSPNIFVLFIVGGIASMITSIVIPCIGYRISISFTFLFLVTPSSNPFENFVSANNRYLIYVGFVAMLALATRISFLFLAQKNFEKQLRVKMFSAFLKSDGRYFDADTTPGKFIIIILFLIDFHDFFGGLNNFIFFINWSLFMEMYFSQTLQIFSWINKTIFLVKFMFLEQIGICLATQPFGLRSLSSLVNVGEITSKQSGVHFLTTMAFLYEQVFFSSITPSTTFQILFMLFITALGGVWITDYFDDWNTFLPLFHRVCKILQQANEDDIEINYTEKVSSLENLKFKNVSFAYKNAPTTMILRNISFEIQRRQIFAIVGAPGSGKTTLLHLIARLYDIPEGNFSPESLGIKLDKQKLFSACVEARESNKILWNDKDIQNFKKKPFRKEVGFVSSNPALMSDTYYEDITLGLDSPLTVDRIIPVLKLVKYNGPAFTMSSCSRRASFNVRFAIAFARAYFRKPSLFLIDEAPTEFSQISCHVLEEVLNYTNGAILIVSHDEAILQRADCVLALLKDATGQDNASQLTMGTHKELMNKNRNYFKF